VDPEVNSDVDDDYILDSKAGKSGSLTFDPFHMGEQDPESSTGMATSPCGLDPAHPNFLDSYLEAHTPQYPQTLCQGSFERY
jgi:hypothetical protein